MKSSFAASKSSDVCQKMRWFSIWPIARPPDRAAGWCCDRSHKWPRTGEFEPRDGHDPKVPDAVPHEDHAAQPQIDPSTLATSTSFWRANGPALDTWVAS